VNSQVTTNTESFKLIREICLQLLTRREYTRLELRVKLTAKGFEHSPIEAIIDELVTSGWQSDQRFAESYSRYRIKKGFGPIKIKYELQQRGIDKFDLEPVVMELAESWDKLIDQVYQKKYTDPLIPNAKTQAKRSRFLLQRGFSSEMIGSLFNRLL